MGDIFIKLLLEQIEEIKDKSDIVSIHEAYGLLAEEVDEFFEEVKKKRRARFDEEVIKELVQIAAVCYRTYYSLYNKGKNNGSINI